MGFTLSVDDKDRLELLVADGKWHLLTIDGARGYVVPLVDMDYEIDLYGPQDSIKANRKSGTVWAKFVRLPANYATRLAAGEGLEAVGDAFAPVPFPVSVEDFDWGAVLTAKRTVKSDMPLLGVAYKTRVPGLRLENRVLNGNPV
jgi:hypothetical protein